MPIVGRRYLLFLSHDFPSLARQYKDLHILTGYELKGGKVFPLDNPGGGTHKIATQYNGETESTLLADLRQGLKQIQEKK